ncbi:ferric uptake regulation protein [Caminibacter mediatlanticus TB-2]|uniref:Ferric uptake regulation protein n=1 Tax=Caminibacter mediatlanticus TB-2 TaxID=391592 RepID=A0ABX5V7C1_9BACT|nr:transcriptional repressor [Caminibacter mediatlanticus]QCT93874.1 ferric uptake regulation protein [Caminibacter mediatlanticus TB-2]
MCEKLLNLRKTEFLIAKLLSKNIMNAKELQEILKVDKATIYRNLKNLIKKEVIREIKNNDGTSFYEIACNIHNPIHPHFECIICKKMYCLKPLSAEDTLNLSKYSNFEISQIEIKFSGICNKCKGEK